MRTMSDLRPVSSHTLSLGPLCLSPLLLACYGLAMSCLLLCRVAAGYEVEEHLQSPEEVAKKYDVQINWAAIAQSPGLTAVQVSLCREHRRLCRVRPWARETGHGSRDAAGDLNTHGLRAYAPVYAPLGPAPCTPWSAGHRAHRAVWQEPADAP